MKKIYSSQIFLKNFSGKYYFEKNNIIIDKICPVCKKYILNKNQCECGYSLKSFKKVFINSFCSYLILSFLFLGFISVLSFSPLKNMSLKKIKKEGSGFMTLSPVNIQIINKIKNTGYAEYIQNLYVNPKKENKLVIIIKPNLWHVLSQEEKNELFELIKKEWENLYNSKNPDSEKSPDVYFANV